MAAAPRELQAAHRPQSDGTTLYYRTRDSGVSYTITSHNDSGSDKVFCYSSATGGQVEETGAGLGAQECKS